MMLEFEVSEVMVCELGIGKKRTGSSWGPLKIGPETENKQNETLNKQLGFIGWEPAHPAERLPSGRKAGAMVEVVCGGRHHPGHASRIYSFATSSPELQHSAHDLPDEDDALGLNL
ncbi:hypothetical protein M758_9G180300 [Ceratodon purpureus]|nr:hypothetical protein M758_9G180300 [Ceratodon purpureus]